jgi:hypothetical protein
MTTCLYAHVTHHWKIVTIHYIFSSNCTRKCCSHDDMNNLLIWCVYSRWMKFLQMSLDDFSKTTLLHALYTDYWLEATIIISSSRNYSEPHRLACVLQVSDEALDWRWSRTAPLHATWSWCCWAGHVVSHLERGGMLGCTPSAYSAPRRNHGGCGCSASATIHSGEDLVFPSSLPLLYTMMGTSPIVVPFKPSCSYWKLWLVLCTIKSP